jgi:nitrogen-specific signal transduction histidine kinase
MNAPRPAAGAQANFVARDERKLQVHMSVDISNREQMVSMLKDALASKDASLSSTSHELRTPLNGILGLSDILLSGGKGQLNEEQTKLVTTVRQSGARLLVLVNDLLDAQSMQHKRLVVKQVPVDVGAIAQEVVQMQSVLVGSAVRLVADVPASVPKALGDSGRIAQILHNLVGNATRFTHAGEIRISAAVVDGGQALEVSVSDTGIGIPEEALGRVFGAFEQVDESTTQKYGGTGLGLALVKQLVEAHGGQICVTSTVGMGSRFTFSLPTAAPDDSIADVLTAPERQPERRVSVITQLRRAGSGTVTQALRAGSGGLVSQLSRAGSEVVRQLSRGSGSGGGGSHAAHPTNQAHGGAILRLRPAQRASQTSPTLETTRRAFAPLGLLRSAKA